MKTGKIIYVTGDIALDTCIYKGNRKSPEDTAYGSVIRETKGGAYLLYDFISNALPLRLLVLENQIIRAEEELKTIEEKPEPRSDELKNRKESLEKHVNNLKEQKFIGSCFGLNEDKVFDEKLFPSKLKTYAYLDLKERCYVPKDFEDELGSKNDAWKADELIGWGQSMTVNNGSEKSVEESDGFSYCNYKHKRSSNTELLVFDDGGNNFRYADNAWCGLLYDGPKKNGIRKENIQHIVLKTAFPLGRGKLFKDLSTNFRDKLTLVTSIHEIRKESVLISQGVSWEQTALDLVYELKHNKAVSQLLKCRRLIVALQSEGALYLQMDHNGDIEKCRLVFDPEHLEGEWEKAAGIQGRVFGLMSVFTAAIAVNYIGCLYHKNKEGNDAFEDIVNMEEGVTQALSAMRKFKIVGHGNNRVEPGLPFENICKEFFAPTQQFASAFVPIPQNGADAENVDADKYISQNWTILEGNYLQKNKSLPLFDTAFRFALHGNNELINSPFLKINKWTSFDRCEIEAVRNIKNLISDYLAEPNPKKPLSFAVFGMPGSGKSFIVKQLCKSLGLPLLEFNLSQYVDFHEMEGSFHQVRDKVLEGATPIVFWDEFDSQQYRWLQYLLAPMQDGRFQSGQITHPIGKSIFVFAGGTSYTFQTFGIRKPDKPDTNDLMEIQEYELNMNKYNDFALKKGPDFKSRLNGYLNILSPNQVELLDVNGNIITDEEGKVSYDSKDILYPVRRALFIRVICGLKENQELKIDYGLLNALIKTRYYIHGSRSMEKILSYLKSKQGEKLRRSDLPALSVLNMLVEKDFIKELTKVNDFDFHAYRIAPEIHQNWMQLGDKEGWKFEYHKDYDYLPSEMKEENIAAARRIQTILDVLRPEHKLLIVSKNDEEFYDDINFLDIIKNDKSILEKLARAEHIGWVETKLDMGWKFGEPRNDDRKKHNCIIGWDEKKEGTYLCDRDKSKDRDAIKNYVKVLEAAGYVIVKENDHDECK